MTRLQILFVLCLAAIAVISFAYGISAHEQGELEGYQKGWHKGASQKGARQPEGYIITDKFGNTDTIGGAVVYDALGDTVKDRQLTFTPFYRPIVLENCILRGNTVNPSRGVVIYADDKLKMASPRWTAAPVTRHYQLDKSDSCQMALKRERAKNEDLLKQVRAISKRMEKLYGRDPIQEHWQGPGQIEGRFLPNIQPGLELPYYDEVYPNYKIRRHPAHVTDSAIYLTIDTFKINIP